MAERYYTRPQGWTPPVDTMYPKTKYIFDPAGNYNKLTTYSYRRYNPPTQRQLWDYWEKILPECDCKNHSYICNCRTGARPDSGYSSDYY